MTEKDVTTDLQEILERYWGYDAFRHPQLSIIQSVLRGEDTVAILPTGAGKSLCYQLPILALDGMCLVISPLIALMEDQKQQLKARGITAAALHSGLSYKDIDRVMEACVAGRVKLLYVSPERLQSERFLARVMHMPLRYVAVDEAHCISQWGQDFRPSYRQIYKLKAFIAEIPLIALTASATPQVAEDISLSLRLIKPNIYRSSTRRENLSYQIWNTEDKTGDLLSLCKESQGSVLIYTQSRSACEKIAKYLKSHHLSASYYHAGIDYENRKQLQTRFLTGRDRIVVCTSAFGMGIDKSDVRHVIHWDLPMSVEEYYQEAGRAGRDGLSAKCVTVLESTDIHRMLQRWESQFPEVNEIALVWDRLMHYAIEKGLTEEGRLLEFDYAEFARKRSLPIRSTYYSLQHLERYGWISSAEAGLMTSHVRMLCTREDLYDYTDTRPEASETLSALLRSYEGLFSRTVRIDEQVIADHLEIPELVLRQHLTRLSRDGIILYRRASMQSSITIYQREAPDANNLADYTELRARKRKQLTGLLRYLECQTCRSLYISEYFGDDDTAQCGSCDLCENRDARAWTQSQIYEMLDSRSSSSMHDLLAAAPRSKRSAVLQAIQSMIEKGLLVVVNDQLHRTS